MTEQEALKIIEESRQIYDTIFELQETLDRDRDRMRPRLEHLRNQLPGLLAAEMLGEIENGDVDRVKSEIAEIEGALEMIPLTYKGLQERQSEQTVKHARATNVIRRCELEAEWQRMKEELDQNYDKVLAQQFRQLSADLGRSDEVRDYVDQLEEKWRKRPSKNH